MQVDDGPRSPDRRMWPDGRQWAVYDVHVMMPSRLFALILNVKSTSGFWPWARYARARDLSAQSISPPASVALRIRRCRLGKRAAGGRVCRAGGFD